MGYGRDEEEMGDDVDASPDSDAAKVDAAQALIDALKASDAEGVSAALSAHYDLCEEGEPAEEEPKKKPSLAIIMATKMGRKMGHK